MSISKSVFIKKYTEAIVRDEAAVFAGAGYSREAGFCDWKGLLRDIATDIELDIEKETDYISLAQYYENANGYHALCNTILDAFSKYKDNYKLAKAVEALPIKTFWTTNYDHFIEDTLRNDFKKLVDIKRTTKNLTCNLRNRDVTVYKFHGDIDDLSSLVITKSDYESFERDHIQFINVLNGDLINKTFVFIGYSFNDPDLFNILKSIRLAFDKNKRTHYAIFKKMSRSNFDDDKEFEYATIKHNLKIADLKRYGIESIEVDEYAEISDIFEVIKKKYLLNNIYIAGSCRKLPENWIQNKADALLYKLGYDLATANYKVCTGCIEGVGPQIENGVLNAVVDNNLNLNSSLDIKRLPLINGNLDHMNNESKEIMRQDIYGKNGVTIFLFGNQYYNGINMPSEGVLRDYERAKEQNMYLIPVGSTGGASKEILLDIEKNIDNYPYLKNYIHILKENIEPDVLIKTIFQILEVIKNSNF